MVINVIIFFQPSLVVVHLQKNVTVFNAENRILRDHIKIWKTVKTTIHMDRLVKRISQYDSFKSAPKIMAKIAGLNVSSRTSYD